MDPEVFRAASTGDSSFFEKLTNPIGSTLLQVTIEKNTVLHVALQFKKFEAVKKIVNLSPSLVYETNSKGNTPLHVAARVGDSSMVKLLIEQAKKLDVETGRLLQLLSMVNQDGDTALHVAVRYGSFDVVKELINENDPAELAMQVNNAGESALFLAVDRQHYDIASHILSDAPDCSDAGRHGMNILHALVLQISCYSKEGDLLPESNMKKYGRAGPAGLSRFPLFILILIYVIMMPFLIPFGVLYWVLSLSWEYYEKLKRRFRKDDHQRETNPAEDLVEQVMRKWPSTIEQGDDSGWTPLHIAAQLGNWRLVKLLLKKDNSPAYVRVRNEEGLSVLHIAAKENNWPIVSDLIDICPDISELLDNKGRNALHAAAESGGWAVVRFFSWTPQFEGLINEKDEEGDTPLHMAVINGHYWIASFLLRNGVDSNATNKKGITPVDNLLLRKQLHCRPTMPLSSKGARPVILMKAFIRNLFPKRGKKQLAGNGNDYDNADGVSKSDLMKQIKKGKSSIRARLSLKGALIKVGIRNLHGNDDGNGNGNGKGTSVSDFGREVSETNLLVATLITTVTFTAAFTVPGGFNQSGSVDEGLAVLSKRAAFGVFLIANTLAFGFSTTSVLIHFLLASDTSTEDVYHSEVIQRAPLFTNWSIGALLVAFISGTYTVVPHSFGISVAVILFCCFLSSMLFPSLNKEV